MRAWLMGLGATAGLFGAAGVALAAAGAHHSGSPGATTGMTTGAYFLLFHAAGLAALCAVAHGRPAPALLGAASLVALGTLLFSGDLALRGLAGVVVVHMAAPTGGVLMILGWLVAAVALPAALGRAPDAEKPH